MQGASLCLSAPLNTRMGVSMESLVVFTICVVEVVAGSTNLGKSSELAGADEAMSDAHSSCSTFPLCTFFPVLLSGKKSLVNRTRLLSCIVR